MFIVTEYAALTGILLSFQVQTKMTRPSAVDDVYVVSNAFSAPGRSAWVEGAFEIVELALKYFQS